MSVELETRRFDAGGLSLAVHTWGGSDPDADNQPILLAHCTGFHGVAWQPVAERLVAAGFGVWSFDFRGHGDSDVPDAEYRWEHFGEDILSVVDHLGLVLRPDVIGVGHSKGAAALVMAEAERTGSFRALWLYEPIIFPADPPPGPTRDNHLAQAARRRRGEFESLHDAHHNFAKKSPFDALHEDALRAYVEHGLRERPDGKWELKCPGEIEARIYEMGSAHDGFKRLSGLTCPVLFVSGSETVAMPEAFARPLAEATPQGSFESAEKLGHFGPMEDPDAMVASIISFAKRSEAP